MRILFISITYFSLWGIFDFAADLVAIDFFLFPQHFLTFLLFLQFGFGFLPLAVLTPLLFEGQQILSLGFLGSFLASSGIAVCYGSCARMLQVGRENKKFRSLHDLIRFSVIIVTTSVSIGLVESIVLSLLADLTISLFFNHLLSISGGHFLGGMILAPLVLVDWKLFFKNSEEQQGIKETAIFLATIAVVGIFMAAFSVKISPFFPALILLGLAIIIAATLGIPGICLYNFGSFFGLFLSWYLWDPEFVGLDFLLLMITVGFSGLFMGILIFPYRERQAIEKRHSNMEFFTFMVGHDFQSPLAMLLNHAEKVRLDKPSSAISQVIQLGSQMGSLIDSLNQFLLANSSDIQWERVCMRRVVQNAIDRSERYHMSENCISLDDLPAVQGNESLLTELFFNLIENALKFSEENNATIRIGFKNSDLGPVFFVEDDNTPISGSLVPQIFNPMRKSRDSKGSGMGLAISQKIVSLHKGSLWLDNKYTEGNRFCFVLGARNKREKKFSLCRHFSLR